MHIPIRRYWALLVNYLKPQYSQVAFLAILLFGSIGIELISPQILRYFIDTSQSNSPLTTLIGAATLFIGIGLINMVVSTIATYMTEKVSWTAINRLRADLALHCLQLDMSFHNSHRPGELIECVDRDVSMLANFFSQFVILILSNIFLLIGVLCLLAREDWRLGIVFFVFVLGALIILIRIRNIATPYWKDTRQINATLFGFIEENLAGHEDIRTSRSADYVMRKFYQISRNLLHKDLLSGFFGSLTGATTMTLFTIAYVIAFIFGSYLFNTSNITMGTIYLTFYYIGILSRPIEQISTQLEDLQKASAGIARIEELLQTKSAIQDGSGEPLPMGALTVEFRNVSFWYDQRQPSYRSTQKSQDLGILAEAKLMTNYPVPSDLEKKPILQDISFRVGPGKVLAILGRTGSGKTTVARLLFRLYDPNQGIIQVGGVDLRAIHINELRERTLMINQNIQLFHATVRDNVTFFDYHIPDQQILQVIRDLGLWSWYCTLPNGLDTELHADSQLSAGEAQLLAFVRAFLHNPDVVILDEVSSRLDPASELLVERAIDTLLHDRTSIIITHRLRVAQRADYVIILENGRIVEQGLWKELAGMPTSYLSELLRYTVASA